MTSSAELNKAGISSPVVEQMKLLAERIALLLKADTYEKVVEAMRNFFVAREFSFEHDLQDLCAALSISVYR